MPRALLIDDEPSAREDLRGMLAAHRAVTVIGEAGLIPAARTLLARDDYDLVFLDVQLRGGSGFDLVPSVRPAAAIVFVTGYERYAVRAFEVNALDYLVKPVATDRLAATLRKLSGATAQPTVPDSVSSSPPSALSSQLTPPATPPPLRSDDRVFLKNDHTAKFVPVTEVSAIISRENYTDALLADGARFFMRRTMKSWEEFLPAELFVRVHRTTLVNLRQIERITEPDSETPHLHLHGVASPVACSHRLSPELRRRLGK
ncbi:MAG: response regulator transcription factor [Undibacterium sp.]|nr:response regulator transcription factor [Opitutaceae bacterium]